MVFRRGKSILSFFIILSYIWLAYIIYLVVVKENYKGGYFEEKCKCNVTAKVKKEALMENPEKFGNKSKKKQEQESAKQNRLLHLREFCLNQINKNNAYTNTFHLPGNLIYNDKQRVIYCPIPKAACTNWKQIILYFDGKVKDALHIEDKELVHRKKFNKMTSNNNRLANYYTFMFVRNPFHRLLSAYRNKFYDPDNNIFRNLFGKAILAISRPKAINTTLLDTYDITFIEFVDYVINLYDNNKRMDPHWERMSLLCRTCSIRYHFIGKMDSLIEDSNTILDELGVNKTIRFTESKEYKVNVKDLTKTFYSTLSTEQIYKLYEVYKDDMQAFDYDVPKQINDIIFERTNKNWRYKS